MRKALTLPAIALASSLALGGTTTAFAAGTPTPSPSASATTPSRGVSLTLPSSPVKPGDAVSVSVSAPAGSKFTVSSAALAGVKLTEGEAGWTGTGTVASVKDGSYGVSLVGTGPDGAKIQATARLNVEAGAPKPTPAPSTVQLSTDFGRPGDKVVVTVKTSERNAHVSSLAFSGGRVDLKGDGKGTFTGTATVANDVKSGYYGVEAFAGGKKFDTVKFSTEGKPGPAPKPHVDPNLKPLKPLKPSERKKPLGSVNTGQAPAGYVAEPGRA
ncbi:hypothetical protein OOK31_33005 [Streptomyces sp. NBC_00249]|uniref:hypothetical protein n=1 Tax=Streptomyces sp. NBC_00249 TaxID=2975690 RepID=UPI00225A1F5F|nr:hypothetical protein [Streptomyces sp. NBC_00249]MCX5198652.1 hypothetical protein [Streptomyces sp. NBC_00249]